MAYLVVGDARVAEEIAMEAFAAALGHWRDIRDPERASAYLRRAVLNLCRSRIRRRQTGCERHDRHRQCRRCAQALKPVRSLRSRD